MKKFLKTTLTVFMLTLLCTLSSLNVFGSVRAISQPEEKVQKTIVDIAVEDGRFKTLVAALKAADLVDTLSSDGKFTVFAPTDDAFNKLGNDKIQELLKPENKDALKDILLYHVYRKPVTASQVMKFDGTEKRMFNGKSAKIEVKNNEVFIDGAKIIVTDIQAKNGIIHVIDAVMIP